MPARIMAAGPQADAVSGFPLALPDGSPMDDCCCVEPGCYTNGCPSCATGRTPSSYLALFADSAKPSPNCGLCGAWYHTVVGEYDPAGYCLGFLGSDSYGGYGYDPVSCCIWTGGSGFQTGAGLIEDTDPHCYSPGGLGEPNTGSSSYLLLRCGSKFRFYAGSGDDFWSICALHFRGETSGTCDSTLHFTNTLPGIGCYEDDLLTCTSGSGHNLPFVAGRMGSAVTLTPCCPAGPYDEEEI